MVHTCCKKLIMSKLQLTMFYVWSVDATGFLDLSRNFYLLVFSLLDGGIGEMM